jgi:hypothetical protein
VPNVERAGSDMKSRVSQFSAGTPSLFATQSHFGNHRGSGFSNEYSNVWLLPNEMMYQDTSLNSYEVIKLRQRRQHEVSLERKKNILQRTQDNLAKEELARHYFIKHGVRPNK